MDGTILSVFYFVLSVEKMKFGANLHQISDWNHVYALRHFLTGGDLVNGMNNMCAVVAVSAHITNANGQIL